MTSIFYLLTIFEVWHWLCRHKIVDFVSQGGMSFLAETVHYDVIYGLRLTRVRQVGLKKNKGNNTLDKSQKISLSLTKMSEKR